IPALLAVLEAGAAYVPLEIGHPPARLQWIAGALDISCVLTESAQRGSLPELPHVICLDRVELERERPVAPPRRGAPDDLAYIIFTSGSTGTPKGVMVRHRPVVNLFRWAYRAFDFSPADRVLFVTSLAFDLSVFDVFGLLGAGGSVRIATEEEIRDPRLLVRALAEEPITFWDSAPAALEQTVPFLAALEPEARPSLRLVFLSGDWIPVTLPDRVRERFPEARVISLGGATEATVWSNVFPIGTVDPVWKSIPYGRPIDNARYHVLDARLAPCPMGVPGDLYIGGDCLADGYAREPELTAGKFLPDPWSATRGGRLYRTGDRARYRPDGNLEFLGRLDHQVKIRGFRIELGEIEAALATLPGVREAVVVVREDAPGDRRLVAYVTGDALVDDLRPWLRERLPESMLPSAFVSLAALPLTPNGKVDRKALPAPDRQRAEEAYVPPHTPVEEIVAGIWAEVLGLERVGAADHFFELGGHSLLATQVVSRLRRAFGVELPLRDLFEAPTLDDLAARIEVAARAGSRPLAPPLVPLAPAVREGALPPSFAQQRLWFIDQLAPGSPLYNIPVALRVEGPLDARVLALCLEEIVRRHEVLRTVFAAPDGSPVQVIRPPEPFELPVVDLAALPCPGRETAALIAEEALRPFDLARGPLSRGLLLRLADGDHVIALTLHHIAGDAWSMGILVREVTALYPAFTQGRPSPLPDLPVQYADFAVWQSSWLRGDLLEHEISFWRRQLAGLPPLLELPTDRPRPAAQSLRGATRPVRLPSGLARRLEALTRRAGGTLFMTLLAGFQALLARYSGQQDLAVGSPVAGRNRVEVERLIGFFVNTLVLRGDLSGGPSFGELLGRARETVLAAHAHQDLPFERLVQELAPERSLAHTPLFQAMLVLQSAPVEAPAIPGLRLRLAGVAAATAKFDLLLTLEERDGGLAGTVEHATELFDGATIDRLIGHFERLLEGAAARPELPVAELPILSGVERGQILTEWNDTLSEPALRGCAHELFAAWARRAPEAVAAVYGAEALTYAELRSRAGHLARHLRRLGVGPDVLVGLMAERSLDMAVGVLGILEAGGAYVPLDPGYPEQRLAWMLADTRSPVLLTQRHLRHRLPAGDSAIVLLDGGGWSEAPGGAVPAAAGPSEESLAYVIFTSGSTGRPKGVALPHGALRNLIDSHLAGLVGGARTLQFASLSFDVSFLEMFACWASGGTLVVVPEELRRDLPALTGLLAAAEVEKAIFPGAVLQQLAEIYAGRDALPPLREIIATGERLQTNQAMAALFRRLPGCAFHNHYGPSETHVATAFTLSADPAEWAVYPSIGRPIRNAATYVLEPGRIPAPAGVPGELFIGGVGGACLARGYLRRPDLTAERFVPDPFGGEPGARLYRTGDKVRLLAGGDLEFLGRFDDQVKIRGFRIEPGEIEQALVALPGVREAVVVAREDALGQRRLVAYVVGDAAPETLRQSLRERLPDYMVPAAVVKLDELPLSPNRKVDRKTLPSPEWQGAGESYRAPRTPVEEVLAGIWTELLGPERVGLDDHFFDLGGHSLLATQVASRLRSTFAVEMPLRELFEAPRLADL
ncbi:MAG TPA: amino acid adenylation domain-containing protein, partial [Thermoanaerobaculia bacterium]|nr:amino acid adenylation domain-containing protein [Thermoanaerobaculia bacterium]